MALTQDDLQKIGELIQASEKRINADQRELIELINNRFDYVDEKFNALDTKLEKIEDEQTEVKKLVCDVLNGEYKIREDMNLMQEQITRLDKRVEVLEKKQ